MAKTSCPRPLRRAAAMKLASSLFTGATKYRRTLGKSASKKLTAAKGMKSMTPASVLKYFKAKRDKLKAKYAKAQRVVKSKKPKSPQAGGAAKPKSSAKKSLSKLKRHVQLLESVKRAATAAEQEVLSKLQALKGRYECLPKADMALIGKAGRFFKKLAKRADTLLAKAAKRMQSLEARLAKRAAKKKTKKARKAPKKARKARKAKLPKKSASPMRA